MTRKDILKTIIVDNQQRVLPEIWKRTQVIPINSGKIITLAGVRRSGKTFHLYQLMQQLESKGIPSQSIIFINFEDERLHMAGEEMDLILQSYQELYPTQNLAECYFFFDEIQEIPEWEKFINRLYTSISENIFLTGSNSKLLSAEIASALRGRTIAYEIHPLSFKEYTQILAPGLNPNSSKDKALLFGHFQQFLTNGGFPETVYQEESLRHKTLQEYFNVMIFRDLIERYQISNPTLLKFFCKRIIANSAGEFSVHKIYNEIKSQGYKISKDTIYAYQDYVESINLNKFVNKYSESFIKSENAQKKSYVIDQGLGAALDFKLSQDHGRLLETTVALDLIKSDKQITYQQNGSECDFLVIENGRVENAIQVSADLSDDKTKLREIKGLTLACKKYDLSEGTIITLDHKESIRENEIDILITPAWEYLLTL